MDFQAQPLFLSRRKSFSYIFAFWFSYSPSFQLQYQLCATQCTTNDDGCSYHARTDLFFMFNVHGMENSSRSPQNRIMEGRKLSVRAGAAIFPAWCHRLNTRTPSVGIIIFKFWFRTKFLTNSRASTSPFFSPYLVGRFCCTYNSISTCCILYHIYHHMYHVLISILIILASTIYIQIPSLKYRFRLDFDNFFEIITSL